MQLRHITADHLVDAWQRVKTERPLIFHISNDVAMPLQANICLAVGGSPIMSQYPTETADLLTLCQGLLINLGTPNQAALQAAEIGLATAAKRQDCLSLLDPVGYGASPCRIQHTQQLLQQFPLSILKGNAGEISLLAGEGGTIKGVDTVTAGDLRQSVITLAQHHACIACATGEVDYLSDGESVALIYGGSAWLPLLSGSGCALGSIMLTCAAATRDALLGSLCGLIAIGIAAERAEQKCSGPGSFQTCLIDALYHLSPQDFLATETRWSVQSA
ncbi:hydroxyethylthiazole kinase [Serratia microhaemolytica]|uniref:hydroxyethylthiazole kinase n=1 Tax=Serratia microhaemolytica TaxID=2675110 RepID=UPI0013922F61|nr:hydroxyethylthiazole kinase [Serratia microhaemolytica]